MTPLVDLFFVVLHEGQTLREYISCLRIKAFKLYGYKPPKGLEKSLINALRKGLLNRSYAAIIETENPDSLEEAYEILKREKVDKKVDNLCSLNENEVVRYVGKDNSQIKEMKDEIRRMSEKIDYLTNLVNRLVERNPTDRKLEKRQNTGRQTGNQKNNFECFNCKRTGHIAKNCLFPCSYCGEKNHSSYNCRKRLQGRNKKYESFREIESVERENLSSLEKNSRAEDECLYIVQHSNKEQAKKSISSRYRERKFNKKSRKI